MSTPGSTEDSEANDETVNPALIGAHSYFPTLVRAAMARGRLRTFGNATRRLASDGRLRLADFAYEVVLLVDGAIDACGFGGRLTAFVERDLDPDEDLGCDFKGPWRRDVGRIVTFATEGDDGYFPVHVFCRDDGSIFVAVVDDDDNVVLSRRHTLERGRALLQDLTATIGRIFPEPTIH